MKHAIIRSCLVILVVTAVEASGPVGAESGTYTTAGDGIFSESSVSLDTRRDAVAVTAGANHTCAVLEDGTAKCWGHNAYGQLGQGDRVNRGDQPREMGNHIAPIDLGAGRTPTTVTLGEFHTCALLDNGTVKCWGRNDVGQLGQGDTAVRGDTPGETGDHLAPIDFGAGLTAAAISAYGPQTCALLDDGTVKCWGDNTYGQLGQGDTNHRGDNPVEMGDTLTPIDLGTGRTATAITVGFAHACALLDDGTAKCWGSNGAGELGQGDTVSRGDDPGEMGDNLIPIDLGTGRTATAITASSAYTCALFDDGTAKCWGANTFGKLGLGDSFGRGDAAGEMGDDLPPIALGIGRTATAIAGGMYSTCALLDNHTAKCWGGGYATGFGDFWLWKGDHLGEMGDNLSPVRLGTGRTVTAISVHGTVACALLDDATVKCWGANSSGQLGQGDSQWRGGTPGWMGDQLLPIYLGADEVFSGVEPVRVLDTRSGLGVGTQAGTGPAPVAAGSSITIPVTALAGVPDNVVAVVVNLTTTRSVEAGFLTVHPCNQPVPEASNLNYRPGIDTANSAIAPVSSSGTICVFTSATTDVIVDVTGYTTTGYQPNTPTRLADTRQTAPQAADTALRVALPSGGGHVVTVTATRATAAGFLTAYDCAQPRPDTSIVNYIPGVDTANLTIATGTDLCVYTSNTVDIIVDDHGRIGGTTKGSQRLFDSRAGGALAAGSTVTITTTNADGSTRAINITATQAAEAGFFSLHPCSTTAPTTSSLNYAPGRDIANLAIIPTDTTMCVTTSATTHLIIDLAATID